MGGESDILTTHSCASGGWVADVVAGNLLSKSELAMRFWFGPF